jgi:DNA polymerase-4
VGEPRKIIHVDMDAFYASVEQRDRPELRGRPVIVGGPPGSRGVVAACSYEARAFGVRSAMPSTRAHRLCPHAVFVPPRMSHYVAVSREIRSVFNEVTDRVEPLSLDEAYLDVTSNHHHEPLAGKLARWLREQIAQRTGLTASAGVGPSKLVAKIASDINKPNGMTIVPPHEVAAFLEPLPVSRLWGVGPKSAARLADLGIGTVRDVRNADVNLLEQRFGSFGPWLARLAWGDDQREVVTSRVAKSRGSETTFASDLCGLSPMLEVLASLVHDVADDLTRAQTRARTLTLKVRYDDFTTVTRRRTLLEATRDERALLDVASTLLVTSTHARERPVRLLGVSSSGFVPDSAPQQLSLAFA